MYRDKPEDLDLLHQNKIFISTVLSLLILYLGLVFLLTLSPFRFSTFYFHQYLLFRQGYLSALTGTTSFRDLAINFFMLAPVGILIVLLLKNSGVSNRFSLIAATFISFLISASIETLQMFLPRITSTIDLINNTLGGFSGALLAMRFPTERSRLLINSIRLRSHKFLRFGILLYIIVLTTIFLLPSFLNTFSNWADNFHLLIGNEATRDRPWNGTIYELRIFNRCLSASRMAEMTKNIQENEIVQFIFERMPVKNLADSTGQTDLLPAPGTSVRLNKKNHSLFIFGNSLLKSRAPATHLINRLFPRSELTIVITFSPAKLNQSGPARIVSLSSDPAHRNFTLGQANNRLNFRVRTPLTGVNGSNVSLFSSPVLSTDRPQTFALTFDRGEIKVYRQGSLIHPMVYDTSMYLPLLFGSKNNGHRVVEICFFLLFPFAWFSRGLWRTLMNKYFFTPILIFLPYFLSTAIKFLLFHHSPDIILLVIHIILTIFVTLIGMAHDILLAFFLKK